MVTEQYAAGALDGSVDPEELTTLLAQENQALRAEIERLQAENQKLKSAKHTLECRFEVSEDTLSCIRDCLRAAEGDIDQLKAENAELIDLMRRVVAEHPRRNHKNDGNGPGHGHRVPGVWDEDNGELAGKPCAWCSIWNAARLIVERHDLAMTKEQP